MARASVATVTQMIKRYFDRSPIPIRTVFLGAFLLAVLFVFTSFIHRTGMGTHPDRFDWLQVAPIPFLNFFTWALLVPLVYQMLLKWPLNVRPIWHKVLVHILLGMLLGVFQEIVTNAIYLNILAYAGRFQWSSDTLNMTLLHLPGGVLQRMMEYWLLLVILMYMESNRQVNEKRTQLLELQNQLQETRLNALKKQLQPHFLFNALNTASALMDEDVNSARAVLVRLGQFLRTTLEEERLDRVPLLREVDNASDYLGIEAMRFRDRLQVLYSIDHDCYGVMVPNLILQPLVENSVKHGPDAMSDPVRIEIKAMRVDGRVRLSVWDDGKGCDDVDGALSTAGIGLRNVRQRLDLMYGKRYSFMVESPQGRGFRVSMDLPVEHD